VTPRQFSDGILPEIFIFSESFQKYSSPDSEACTTTINIVILFLVYVYIKLGISSRKLKISNPGMLFGYLEVFGCI
jgi:hypothetical protein